MDVEPNAATFVSCFYGRWVHESIDHKVIKWDIQIGTAMVDMYAKCGCIEMAMQIFNGMPHKNALTWNAMLNGWLCMVMARTCCHCGLVGEGRRYFHWMKSQQYNLHPRLEHYGCTYFVELDLLDEALELTKAMPMLPDVRIMGALLARARQMEMWNSPKKY
ncbi:hypothetical protein NC653_035464 [Populus alba x Populus x berolinensis]|uniref:Pentatricopeptide repeat-containing protein n=1 Tax=Populus alba x Populus x berolinensis TaxID=444605 RepID=A0AAD6PZ39_9ROSI|nr:hypothetical protein NC653_035464 [Populus alba x Populus x berolinensis]